MTKTRQYTPSAARFSLRWWLVGARNLFFVALVTLLIWVYADMDVAEDRSFHATVVLTTGRSQDVELLTPGEINVKFSLRGTRRGLRSFQEQLDQARGKVEYNVAMDYPPGSNSVSLENLLNQSGLLNRLSLSLISAAPSNISFTLDKRVTEKAVVKLDYTGAKLSAKPIIEPSQVTVHIARIDLDNLRKLFPQDFPDGKTITLKTRQLDLAGVATGQSITQQVEVIPPATNFPVKLKPNKVSVTFQIYHRTDTKTLTVNVQTVTPSSWPETDGTWRDYCLTKKDPGQWRRQITVSGARKDIEKLKQEDVVAYVVLTERDKAPVASWLMRTVQVRFPDGMDIELLGEPLTVSFRLTKRQPAGAASPTPAPAIP